MDVHPSDPGGGVQRIALVGPSGWAMRRLRGALISELTSRRHSVLCVAERGDDDDRAALKEFGADFEIFDADPPGLAFLAERSAIASLAETLSAWQPHAALGFGSRSMVYGALAASRAKVGRVISMVSGLPNAAMMAGRTDVLPPSRYRDAFRVSHAVVVHNVDDGRRLSRLGMLKSGLPAVCVPGAGVDISHHAFQPLPPPGDGLVYLMIARIEKAKGVLDYCKAAVSVKSRAPQARFLLAGPPGADINPRDLEAFSGAVEILGPVDDVRPLLASCHVFVFPSYGEGMPPSVLEALATGRPIVTTDVPGCRDTVDEAVNGRIVPAGDAAALAAAMESFLKRPDLIPAAARASRSKAERLFDHRPANELLLRVLGVERDRS